MPKNCFTAHISYSITSIAICLQTVVFNYLLHKGMG